MEKVGTIAVAKFRIQTAIPEMTIETNQQNKQLVWNFWQLLEQAPDGEAASTARQYLSEDVTWHGFDPINELTGPADFVAQYWLPLKASFSNLKRETHMFLGGLSLGRADGNGDDGMWTGGTGHFHGRFVKDWLGIPASGEEVQIRWGELCQVVDGKIAQIYILLDLVDLLQQTGRQLLPPARGKDGVYPPPRDDDAIYLDVQSAAESTKTLDLIRRFIFESLNVYDQEDLQSMGVADYFPADIQWYGPGGIGACLGLQEFEDLHQRHWLQAFPDRAVQNLDCLFAEGGYTAGAGWNGVLATHAGEYLGAAPTGKRIAVTGLDFWRREGSKFTENWVFVDMIHLFRQFGIDLLARVK
jgi:predicted ester cyclase